MDKVKQNFLFIIADQLRADHVGFGGNSVVQTPNIDDLAARATQFNRAYVANPICMPNRASILTGRMPSVHGTRFNGIPLDRSAHTFVRELHNNGYHTGHIGKAHYQNLGDGPSGIVDKLFPVPGDALTSPHPDGWDQFEMHEAHQNAYVEMPPDYYGFQHTELLTHHSDLCAGHYYHWVKERGYDLRKLQGPANAKRRYDQWQQVYQTALPEEIYPTRYVADRSCRYLEDMVGSGNPFFLHVSFPDPHHPFTPPGKYYDMYEPASIDLPATFYDPHEASMPHYRFMTRRRGKIPKMWVAAFSPTEDQFRHAAAAEYGMISLIDHAVGQILATLDATGLAENTIVIFTSDHGDMFGDHGIMLKGAMHYEGAIRIPLLIARPEQAALQTEGLAGSLDLAQTLLELAGVPEYHGLQGVSLVPMLDDADVRVRTQVLIEEDEMFDMMLVGHPFRARTLITENERLSIYQHIEQGELFDLSEDPGELHNAWTDPSRRTNRNDLTEQLARELMNMADTSPKPTHMA
ncbi:MAG: sulfatase-like hydrolase/transferase [Gammaproteobacteria bacterium]|nr:sulfatase-like hydrolase/transferase [Gammaproteobacteria bacterium]